MAEGTPDLSGLLSGLLSNPSAVSSLLGLLGGITGGEGKRADAVETGSAEPTPPQREEAVLPAMAPPEEGHGGRRGKRERECLIGALCPYLSPERRRAAEGACKLIEILELFDKGRR